jgi:hypothetical protein
VESHFAKPVSTNLLRLGRWLAGTGNMVPNTNITTAAWSLISVATVHKPPKKTGLCKLRIDYCLLKSLLS